MADEKDDTPVQPIVRKKKDEAAEAEEKATEDSPPSKAAPEPAAEKKPEPQPKPDPEPADEPPATPANPELAEKFDQDKPVPGLSRRVVDMKTYKPKPKKKTEPDPMLVEKSEEKQNPTSPERPSAKTKESPQVRVEAGSLEDFEAMLAGEGATPKRERVEVGEKYDGVIASIGQKWIYVDLGSGNEGVARVGDFTDKEGNLTLSEGDRHAFYVLSVDEGGTVSLGDQLSTREAAMDAIYTALDTGAPLQGRVAQKNKGGFEIELGGVRAFCPISQIELAYTEDPEEHVGKSYQFRVTEIREEGRSIVVSRAALLREKQEEQAAETLQRIAPGMTVEGRVTRIADFGAFVDIGGVEGLVHVSEMGFGHVDDPSEVVNEGDHVQVNIQEIERGEKIRIGLSMKDTMEDPWETVVKDLHVGKKVTGTVTRLEPFGAFVEVLPHVEGLVHVSEMSWEKHVKNPADVVSTGQQITVQVQDIDLARRRISLSMKGAEGDPWNDIEERYRPGQEVTGSVENVEDFGAFVALGSGITALIPRSEMGLGQGATSHSRFSKGQEVTARVLSIEPDRRRMALTMKSADEVEASAGSGQKSWSEGSKGLGTLGDLLKDKLND